MLSLPHAFTTCAIEQLVQHLFSYKNTFLLTHNNHRVMPESCIQFIPVMLGVFMNQQTRDHELTQFVGSDDQFKLKMVCS
jgi:hypothetical protein